jgi:hypothetical protein
MSSITRCDSCVDDAPPRALEFAPSIRNLEATHA